MTKKKSSDEDDFSGLNNLDLREYQEGGDKHEEVRNIFGKLLSGRDGYETVVEKKRKKIKKCECGWPLKSGEKFCSECGMACVAEEK